MELVTTKRKNPRLDLCIICQKDIHSEKSTCTQHGKKASKKLNDDLLEDIEKENIDCIR